MRWCSGVVFGWCPVDNDLGDAFSRFLAGLSRHGWLGLMVVQLVHESIELFKTDRVEEACLLLSETEIWMKEPGSMSHDGRDTMREMMCRCSEGSR